MPRIPNPYQIKINDARSVDAVSGKPINDSNRFSHSVLRGDIEDIVEHSTRQGVDPYTALAMALQETGMQREPTGEYNPFHVDYSGLNRAQGNTLLQEPIPYSIHLIKQKLALADKLGKNDEAGRLQAWNGYGKVFSDTEQRPGQEAKQFYGVDVTKEPIDMNKTPLYGHRVIDLRDNVIKKSPEIQDIVEKYLPPKTTDPKYAAQPVLTGFAEGGIANTGEPQANQNVPDSHFMDNSKAAPTNTPFQQVVQRAQNEYKEKVDKGVHPDKAQKEANDFIRLQSKNFVNRADDVIPIDKEIERTPESALTEFGKSIYNGFLPPVIKLIPDIASIATNAVGLHSDIIDNFSDDVSKWVDKNATAWINPEHNQGIFKQNEDGSWGLTDAKSMINGLGQGMGTIANFAALAYLTGGAGDVTEAVELINAAKLTGDAIGLAKATTMLKSAQASLTATKWISGSLVFMPQIWEDGKKAGLNPTDNARMTMALGVALGGMGTISGVEKGALEKFATRGAISEIEDAAATNLSDKGILRGLEGLPKGVKLSENEFKTAFKATMSDASSIAKRVIGGNVPKATVKEFGQMYLQSAVQTSGEQLYDVMFADGKEPGKGAYGAQQVVGENDKDGIGPSVFGYRMGKRAFMNDLQSGIYGGILGAGMASYRNPLVNQSLYGYLDSKIRDGKAEEGVGKVKKMAEVLLKKGKLDPQRYAELVGTSEVPESQGRDGKPIPAQPAKKGLIDQMAETAQGLKGVNSDNLTPAASYDAYNYQYNERPIFDAKVQKFEDVKTALAQTLSEPTNQNPATADVTKIASLQKMVAEGYKDYRNNVESVHEINKHISGIAATGKMSDIGRKLSEIKSQKHDWSSDESLKPLMAGYDAKPHSEVMKEQNADKNGITHSDLVGHPVRHIPSGEYGTVVKEKEGTHSFQPEIGGATTPLGSGEDVVDRRVIDHYITERKKENAVQKSSTEKMDVRQQTEAGSRVRKGQSEGGKATETRQEAKAVDLDSLKDKRVRYKGKEGKLSIDEGGKVSFESEDGRMYDIATQSDNRNATDYGITPIKEAKVKEHIASNVSETEATVNGQKYTIHTDDKGNITGLSPENNPDQIIRNEKMIVAVEVERNKSEFDRLSKQSESETHAEIQEAKSHLSETEQKATDAVERAYTNHMNERVSSALDALDSGNSITPEQQAHISAYTQRVAKALDGLKAEYGDSEIIQEAKDGLDLINKIAKENVTESNRPEATTEEHKESSETKETGTEEPTDHFPEELKSVKPEISPEEVKQDEAAIEEVKPELEAEAQSDPKVKEVFEEAGKRVVDLDERAKKQRETKAAKQEIKFKERKELLAAEPSTPEEMILQYFVEGNKIHTDDLKSEVANSGTDFNKLIWSHSKSSPTLDNLIEQFQERWQHEHGPELDYTDLRNEIISALTGHDTKWSMEEALRTAFADSNGTVVQAKVERAQVRHNEEEARHAEGLKKQSKAKLESLKAELETAKYAWEKAKSRLEKNGQQDQIDIFGKKPADESLFRNDIKEQESIVAEKKAEFDRLQKEVNNFEEQLPNQKDMFVDKAKEHLDELLAKKETEDDGCPF